MSILELLDKKSDCLLISYKDTHLTQKEFSRKVNEVLNTLALIEELKTENFIVIESDNPIEFYILLFALYSNNNRVSFPNKDFFQDNKIFNHYEYKVYLKKGRVKVEKNNLFSSVKIDANSDTILFSSGSTGKPKGIAHSNKNFMLNASSVDKFIKKSNYKSIIYLKPYLVSALSHFLVHFISNSHLVFVDFDNINVVNDLIKSEKKLSFVGSPIHLFATYSILNNNKYIPEFLFSSGDFMHPNIIEKYMSISDDVTFFNAYGLAELGGRFFINKITSDVNIEHYSNIGNNIEGTSFEIKDDMLYVRADFLFNGYMIDNKFSVKTDVHPTSDLVKTVNNNLRLYGRSNDEIKVGGNKVSLKYIESQISKVLKDDLSIVVSKKHDVFGSLVVLVLKTSNNYTKHELLSKLRETLALHEIPHLYYFIDKIPFNQSMKIDRSIIAKNLDKLKQII